MIRDERGYMASVDALNDLKNILKRFGAVPCANPQEIQRLREQVKDLQGEIDEYEHHRLNQKAAEYFNEEPVDEP